MNEDIPVEEATNGIYSTCELCFAIVAHLQGHLAWHVSRGEAATDALK